uniref:Small ribosomal subunit protein mS38 n=1 Tax=Equus caballus TaxID=9796 RepID=A0A9L0QYK8_HORSE
MLLGRLTAQLLRVVPRAGCSRPGSVSGVLGHHACGARYSTQPAGPSGVASLPGSGVQLELEEMLVPRKMSISPLESWLTTRYLLPRLDAGVPGSVAPAQLYEHPPSQMGEGAEQGGEGVWDAPQMQCKNVLKIRRRKMNHHKYRKLVKRTRFLRRKVREGRLKRKQASIQNLKNRQCVLTLTCLWGSPRQQLATQRPPPLSHKVRRVQTTEETSCDHTFTTSLPTSLKAPFTKPRLWESQIEKRPPSQPTAVYRSSTVIWLCLSHFHFYIRERLHVRV